MSATDQPAPPKSSENVTNDSHRKALDKINEFKKHHDNLQIADDVISNVISAVEHADVAFGFLTMGIGTKIFSLIKLCYDKTKETIRANAEEKVIDGILKILDFDGDDNIRRDLLKLVFDGNPSEILMFTGKPTTALPRGASLIDRIVGNDNFVYLARLVHGGATLNATTAVTSDTNQAISVVSYIDSINHGWLDQLARWEEYRVDGGIQAKTGTRREYLLKLGNASESVRLPRVPYLPADEDILLRATAPTTVITPAADHNRRLLAVPPSERSPAPLADHPRRAGRRNAIVMESDMDAGERSMPRLAAAPV